MHCGPDCCHQLCRRSFHHNIVFHGMVLLHENAKQRHQHIVIENRKAPRNPEATLVNGGQSSRGYDETARYTTLSHPRPCHQLPVRAGSAVIRRRCRLRRAAVVGRITPFAWAIRPTGLGGFLPVPICPTGDGYVLKAVVYHLKPRHPTQRLCRRWRWKTEAVRSAACQLDGFRWDLRRLGQLEGRTRQ